MSNSSFLFFFSLLLSVHNIVTHVDTTHTTHTPLEFNSSTTQTYPGTAAMPRTTPVCDQSYKDWGNGQDQLFVSVTFLTEFGDLPLIQVFVEEKDTQKEKDWGKVIFLTDNI